MKRLRTSWKKITLSAVVLTLILSVGIYQWLLVDLPDISALEAGLAIPSTRIYDRNGQLLYEVLPPDGGRNVPVSLEDIPAHCIHAVIATEDANFYYHPGVDPVGILRALWINLRGGEVLAGGSTITQQVARNTLLDPQQRTERTLQRKLRESILAIRLQNTYSKEEILLLYLNQVYFGNLAYGIEGAAQAYFAKSARELSLAECALLAGIVQNPALHDPLTRLESAQERQQNTLRLMVANAMISEEQAEQAQKDQLQFAATRFPIEAPHFVMAVWAQLQQDYGAQLYSAGLDVITTVDLNWQNAAQQIVQQQLDEINNPLPGTRVPANAYNAALVAIDPLTGQVLTMLGSPDYFNANISGAVNAALAYRQPGSALKPFTYAAAMDPTRARPYTPATMLLDVHTPFITRRLESYTPSNYGMVEHGPVLLREALASSYNIPAVIALEDVGLQTMIELAADAGLTSLMSNPNLDLAVTLGGGEVRLLDMTQAYSVFANGGYRIEPTLILSVTSRDGQRLYEWQAPKLDQRLIDARVAYLINDILSDSQARIPGFGTQTVLEIGRPAAAKTGTTTDYRDNWVVGYTPNLVTGVWVGNADNTPMTNVTGITGAGPIWNVFMRQVLRDQPKLDFTRPDGITEATVCSLSGLLPTELCPHRRIELFIDGTVPTEPDDFYQRIVIDRTTGLLADETTAARDREEPIYAVMPQAARNWALQNGIPQPPLGSTVHPTDTDGLRLLAPDPHTVFQIAAHIPAHTQRLLLRVAAPAQTQTITWQLNSATLATLDEPPWQLWWTLEPGSYTLVATAQLNDGSTLTSPAVPFTVNPP